MKQPKKDREPVNFRRIVEEVLADYPMTETALAARVGVVQQTISKLRRGVIVNPSYEVGAKLVSIWEARP